MPAAPLSTGHLGKLDYTIEVAKGFLGMPHAYKFENKTEEQVLVLLEEDPEGMMQQSEYSMGMAGDIDMSTLTGREVLGAKTNALREGPRPPQQLVVGPGEKAERSMKSSTILWSAAFLVSTGEVAKTFKIFKQGQTMDAGSTSTILEKHTRCPISQDVEAVSFLEALAAAASPAKTPSGTPSGTRTAAPPRRLPGAKAVDPLLFPGERPRTPEGLRRNSATNTKVSQPPQAPLSPKALQAATRLACAPASSRAEPEAELCSDAELSGVWRLLHQPEVRVVVKNNTIESSDGALQQRLSVSCDGEVSIVDRGRRVVGKVTKRKICWSDGIVWVREVPLPSQFLPLHRKLSVLSRSTNQWRPAVAHGFAVRPGIVEVGKRKFDADLGSFYVVYDDTGESDLIHTRDFENLLKME